MVLTAPSLQVSGLAKRVHDNTALRHKFEGLVTVNSDLQTNRRALTRHVATRWNTDHDCLEAHRLFRPVINQLTIDPRNNLLSFRLDEDQWELSEVVEAVLVVSLYRCITTSDPADADAVQIFDEPTKLFSKAEVPLISEALPMLVSMKEQLIGVREDESLRDIVRVAAQAAVVVLEKYLDLMMDSEMYLLAIGTCFLRRITSN